jgi:hypothetical protein
LPLKESFSPFLYRFYVAFRRFFFYLGVNDSVSPFHSIFEEKNPAANEMLTTYDSYEQAWLYAQAAPLMMPEWRPGILKLFSKIFSLSPNLRLLVLPSLVLLWLSSLMALLAKSLLLLFCLPLAFFSATFLWLFSHCGSVRLYLFTFLKSAELLSLCLRPQWAFWASRPLLFV